MINALFAIINNIYFSSISLYQYLYQGLIIDMPCFVNITLTDIARISRAGLLQQGLEIEVSQKLARDLSIKTPSVKQFVRNLSGGNQQKVVLAKWLFADMDVLIFDEPTRGIDVGAKYEIYLLLWKLAAAGKSIIIVSSDLPELMGICHRILVFSNGSIAGELDRGEFDQEQILALVQPVMDTIQFSEPEQMPLFLHIMINSVLGYFLVTVSNRAENFDQQEIATALTRMILSYFSSIQDPASNPF